MGINLVGAGAGASAVGHHQQHDLEDLLTQAFRQKQVEQEMELRRQMEERMSAGQAQQAAQHTDMMGVRNREFEADQSARTAAAAHQAKVDDRQAGNDRQVENQRSVRRMIGEFLTQRGGQPLDAGARQQLTGMAVQEDVDLPKSVTEDPNAANAEWDRREGIEQRNRLAQIGAQGAQTRQTVATRATNVGGGNPDEALDTAQEVQRIAKALRDAPGRSGAFGVLQSKLPTMRQGTADAEVLLNSLRSLLTLENTGKLKGVLSNADMELLRQASSTLAAQMSDPAAVAELNRLGQVMSRVTQQPWDAPAPTGGGGEAEYDYVNGKLVRRGSAAR